MAAIRWTTHAAADLAAVHDYIARDSSQYAVATVEKILTAVARLSSFPESGRRLPEYPERPQREILVGSYRVIYRHDACSRIARNAAGVTMRQPEGGGTARRS